MSAPSLELVEGPSVLGLLGDPGFLAQWQALCAASAHATVFQDPVFARCWYQAYQSQWHPLLVLWRASEAALQALWPLAFQPQTRQLVQAGAHQAEYQAWLALPGVDLAFLDHAWRALTQRFHFASLRLKYLPSAAQLQTLQAVGALSGRLLARDHARPLRLLTAQDLGASLAKKSNHSRLNRLRRLGALELRRIASCAEFEQVFDTLIDYYDFRQGATHHSLPFREDPCKRAFHAALFAQLPAERLCLTVAYLDGSPISAFWGLGSGHTVHLGMLLHTPFLAAHSPGKLHLLQLGQHLLAQGQAVLDLTPGADPWKERFANAHDPVAEATLYRSRWQCAQVLVRDRIAAWAKRWVQRFGLRPAEVRAAWVRLRRLRLGALLRRLRQLIHSQREMRVYRCTRAQAWAGAADSRVQRNALSALLCFAPTEPWQSRDAFLSGALQRLENGEAVYTVCLQGQLAHRGWMVRQTQSFLGEVGQTWTFPPHSVALYDFYTPPHWRGQGLYRATIAHMLQDAFADTSLHYAYITVLADNAASRHVIESMGFAYQGSGHWQCHLGRVSTWQRLPPPQAASIQPQAVHA